MTRDEFTAASIALLRSAVGWQSAIARRLGVESRTVRRWLAAGETPAWADAKLADLMGGQAPGPFPRDEWIVGDAVSADGRQREYIVHAAPPRFIARVVRGIERETLEGDASTFQPAPEEEPADTVSGTVFIADAQDPDDIYLLCEIDWIDRPAPGEVTLLLEAAADALDEQSTRDAEEAR